MTSRSHPAFFWIFVLVLAPIAAVVVVMALLLFHVPPRLVFAPGWAVKGFLARSGVRAPNAVGVLLTVGLWWLIFVAAGIVRERRRR